MIDVNTETLLPFSKAAKRCAVTIPTLYSWAFRGTKEGWRLESIKLGGKRFTSEEALERFVEAQNPDQPEEKRETRTQRKRRIDKVKEYLKQEGLL